MPSLRELITGRRGSNTAGATSGVLRVGYGSSYNAIAWGWSRTINSVVGNPTGYRCLEQIVNNVSRPEFEVSTKDADEPLDSHPLLTMLNRPAPGVSGTSMQRQFARDLELAGKSCWLKVRGRDGYGNAGPTTGLRRLAIDRTTVMGNADDELVGFVYEDRSGNRVGLLPDDVLYLRFPHPERNYDGLAPALVAGLAAETDLAASRFNYDLLSNDGALPGYITVDGLTPAQFAEWKAAWEGGETPGKTRFLGGSNSKYVKVGQTNQELTYDELRRSSQQDVARCFGVPMTLIDPTDSTFANMAEGRAMFWQQTILPKLVAVADDMTVQLGADFGGVQVGFSMEAIEELADSFGDTKERIDALKVLIDLGFDVGASLETVGLDPMEFTEPEPAVEEPVLDPAMPPAQQPLPAGDVPVQRDAPELAAKGIQAPTLERAPQEWRTFDRRVTALEARTHRTMQQFFAKQGASISSRVRGQQGKALTKAVSPDNWWDGGRWDAELSGIAADFLLDAVDALGTTVSVTLGGPAFDVTAERVTAYLQARSVQIAQLVNDTTQENVRAIIAALDTEGASIPEIADAIQAHFTEQGPMRAERVARTEVIGAANFGTVEAARQSGVVTAKTWLATADDRVDADCADLDGMSVGLDESFGDVDAPPLHPNCRCTVLLETQDPEAAGTRGSELLDVVKALTRRPQPPVHVHIQAPPTSPTVTAKRVERDSHGNIARIIEET